MGLGSGPARQRLSAPAGKENGVVSEFISSAIGTASILVADDTPAHLGVVVDSLERQGFRVLVALDGVEAVERAQFSQPDLILLDVKMPGIDGFETCRRLKMKQETLDIPVIFMTSLADTADVIEGFSAGGVDYVTKPVQVAEMMARVGTHLRMRAMHKQLIAQNLQLQREVSEREQVEAQLRRARDELEKRVIERTEELARANVSLTAEIAERRRADAMLQSSETRFRTIAETSPVPLLITAMPEGRILYTNQSLRTLLRLDADELSVTNIVDFYMNAVDREVLVERLRHQGNFHQTEIHFRRTDGTTFWAIVTARVAIYADAPAIFVGLNDITASKEAAEKLRVSEASLANAQRLARLGDWEWDSERGTMRWSDELYRILGLSPAVAMPSYQSFLDAAHPDERAALRRVIRNLRVGRQPYGIDYRVVVHGTECVVQFQAEIKRSVAGRPTGIIGTIQDITERKRIEQELRASREQLRELSAYLEAVREEERKRIAMEIHDELGQLLTALKMDVSLLKMRLAGDLDAAKKTDNMRELVEKTIWMVRHVVNDLRPAALNFGIVSALEWLAEDFSRRHHIPCQLRVRGGEPTIADALATAVFRIVQESLTNVARHAEASRVTVMLVRSDTAIDLQVKDDGRGFDPGATRKGYSYGMLSMSERTRLMGGSLSIDSEPGAGTVVLIHIPISGDTLK
jgi:PAS domain S-box-containing protein